MTFEDSFKLIGRVKELTNDAGKRELEALEGFLREAMGHAGAVHAKEPESLDVLPVSAKAPEVKFKALNVPQRRKTHKRQPLK